jgi:hypothetical protein
LWVLIYGLGSKVGQVEQLKKPRAPLLSLFDHLLFGSLLGLITAKLAGESLFDNNNPS